MTVQRRLLQAMLVLLGLAALAGAATVFVSGRDIVGRMAGTLAVAAIAIGLAVPASRRLEREEARPVGLASLGAIVVGFVLALAAIWGSYLPPAYEGELALTTFAYIGAAVPGVIFFAIARRSGGRAAGIAGMCFAAATFVLWIVQIWSSISSFELAASTAVVLTFALPVVACLGGAGWDRPWRFVGAAAGFAGIALGVRTAVLTRSADLDLVTIELLIVCAALGAINLLSRAALPRGQRWAPIVAMGAVGVTAVIASFVNLTTAGFRVQSATELPERLLSAAAIVTGCAGLAVIVLMAFNRRVLAMTASSLAEIRTIHLACPRCGRRQQAPLGESRCAGCGLIFLLRVAEPRCAKCDYTLLDLTTSVCPECGEPVASSLPGVA